LSIGCVENVLTYYIWKWTKLHLKIEHTDKT